MAMKVAVATMMLLVTAPIDNKDRFVVDWISRIPPFTFKQRVWIGLSFVLPQIPFVTHSVQFNMLPFNVCHLGSNSMSFLMKKFELHFLFIKKQKKSEMCFGRMASVCEGFFFPGRSLNRCELLLFCFTVWCAHRRSGMNWNRAKIITITATAKSIYFKRRRKKKNQLQHFTDCMLFTSLSFLLMIACVRFRFASLCRILWIVFHFGVCASGFFSFFFSFFS